MSKLNGTPTVEEIKSLLQIKMKVDKNQKVVRVFCWIVFAASVTLGSAVIIEWAHATFKIAAIGLSILGIFLLIFASFSASFFLIQQAYLLIMKIVHPELLKLEAAKRLMLPEYGEALNSLITEKEVELKQKELKLKEIQEELQEEKERRRAEKFNRRKNQDYKTLGMANRE